MTKRETITIRAKEILASCPEGIRFSELVKRLRGSFPGEAEGNLTGNAFNLHVRFPDEIYKPARGLFRLTRFRDNEVVPVRQVRSIRRNQIGGEDTMSSLSQTLETVRTKIARLKGMDPTEATTKVALINPVLCALGWDVENPEHVALEDKGKDKKYNPPDYILLLNEKPKLLVEAKRLGEKLDGDKWADAIMGYAGAAGAGAEWIVLTNGDDYHIYNATAHVSSFGERLFRAVRLSDPESPAEETLALLSRERIGELQGMWDKVRADRQVRAAIERLFLPEPHSLLLSFVRKQVEGLKRTEIKASVWRVCKQISFRAESTRPPERKPPPVEPDGTREGNYRQFWEPMRREGLFAGKPADGPWITKSFRRIALSLVVHNHACCVDLGFVGQDRTKRRDKALQLLAAAKYPYELHDTPKCSYVRFPVLDKGIKDREHLPEIRKKLTSLGQDIYNRLSKSDV